MNLFIKDKVDFLENYHKLDLAEKVFYKEVEDKVEIKIAAPYFQKEVKKALNKIKN